MKRKQLVEEPTPRRQPTQVLDHDWPFPQTGNERGLVRNVIRPVTIARRKVAKNPTSGK